MKNIKVYFEIFVVFLLATLSVNGIAKSNKHNFIRIADNQNLYSSISVFGPAINNSGIVAFKATTQNNIEVIETSFNGIISNRWP